MGNKSKEISAEERASLEQQILKSSSYRLAFEDMDYLMSDDLLPTRLQLELLKPERSLRENNIHSTIVVFGSARILPPEVAQEQYQKLKEHAQAEPNDNKLSQELFHAKLKLKQSHYYTEAQHFSEIVSQRFQQENRKDFVIVTGGGPGIMEAANRGAYDADARSIGFNITLPSEQAPNPFISPELCFQFHYFALRKMLFLLRAKALVAFPGGFGTLDELFEMLTLIQTGKVKRIPIVLVGKEFWNQAISFRFLVEQGVIAETDIELFSIVDKAEEAVTVLENFYNGVPPE